MIYPRNGIHTATEKNGADLHTLIQKNSLNFKKQVMYQADQGLVSVSPVSNLGKLHNLGDFVLVMKAGVIGSPFVHLP